MKNSFEIAETLDEKYHKILSYDHIQIDNPDLYHHLRLGYLDRINMIISLITKLYPNMGDIKIGDFACGQGNLSLMLAEMGAKVTAVDIEKIFIEYAKKKYEKGVVDWIGCNIEDLDLPGNMFDVAIAGEIIEHCAYPEDMVERVLNYIRPGGSLVVTTPNGDYLRNHLPTFNEVRSKNLRRKFESQQFGPDGEYHLFLFNLEEIREIFPPNAKIIERGYMGGTVLINEYSRHLFKVFPVSFVEKLIRFLARIPIINRKTFYNIYVLLKKV